MKKMDFLIFFSIVFTIYGLINFYIFIRGWQVLSTESSLRTPYLIFFLIISLSFIAGRIIERIQVSWFSTTLIWIGSFWLGLMVYFFLFILLIDVFRLINHFIPFLPKFIFQDYSLTKLWVVSIVVVLTFIIVISGHINTHFPKITRLELSIPKSASNIDSLNIAVASDIHLGTIVCQKRLEKIVNEINKLNPDLVVFPGDVIDEDTAPVIKQDLGKTLLKIKSKYGIYSCTGNHEYIGGVEKAVNYLTQHNIKVLRDIALKVDNNFYLIGREDLSIRQFAKKNRKSLNELMIEVDRTLPIILLDHQPLKLEQADSNGIDLQVSGHTHHGQLWPFNFITEKVYELSWGYKKKENTHYYVSCGVGTWGPPVRTGNRPEIVNIILHFQKQ